jgi:hypothetical protein
MKKVLFLLPLIMFFTGCTNFYSKFYVDHTGGLGVLGNPRIIAPSGEPKLIQGSNVETDCLKMSENGYILIGESRFGTVSINQNMAVEQAKKVYADTVIVYSQYSNTISGIVPLTVPNTQTTYHSGSIYGSGGVSANYSGSSTTYGTQTTYIPYAETIYDYYATYWAKAKPMSLGINFGNLTDELRRKAESNKGVYITAVVKDSPAFNADLLRGDIIRKLNDTEVIDEVHFGKIIAENKGQQIKLEIFRDGKTIIKQIQLN